MAASDAPSDDGISCWICLGEGDDDEGRSLLRDCSCRGSQGFAHFSCLVDYARHRCENWDEEKSYSFRSAWRICPTCLQPYQDKLTTDLVVKFEAFVEERFPDDMHKRVDVLDHKMFANTSDSETVDAATELLLVVEQIRASEYQLPRDSVNAK